MKIRITLFSLLLSSLAVGQINAGKIVFERKTNLEKKFSDARMKKMLGDGDKIRVDLFEFYFNDTCSIFKPILSDEADPMSWTTSKNTVVQNFNTNQKLLILSIWGQQINVTDSNTNRQWKITDSKRNIANYECTKAVWQKNDSTRLYAWFSPEIVPSVGPEGFDGLPGAILGLATEDGGIIYFAKSVEELKPNSEVYKVDLKKKEVYTMAELKDKIEKEYGSTPMGKRIFVDLFRWL
jgi:GLPGLI family protein